MHSAELREKVKVILASSAAWSTASLLIPEEVVHYSEWLHVMRERISSTRSWTWSNIRATIHPACHVYKMVPEDVIYDDTVMEGNRVAVSTGLMQTLGAQVIDYSTWYDCCGFGFRHIIGEREFRPLLRHRPQDQVAVEEAKADVMVGHDTGCITNARQEPMDRQGGRQGLRAADPGRLPVRRARARRASLQAGAIALARLAVRRAAGEARHRLGEGQGRVRGLSRRGEGRRIETLL